MPIRRAAALAAFALLMPIFPAVAANHQIIQVEADRIEIREQLGLLFGHFRYDDGSGIATLESDAFSRERLSRLGIDWRIDEIASVRYRAFLDAGLQGLRAIPGFACYRTVEETFDTMDALVAEHPGLASIVDIGQSWRRVQNPAQGWPIRVLRLGNQAAPGPKPTLFAMSSVHAREYTPAELMTRFAEKLLAGYGKDADATWLLDHHEFHLLLQANPDGRKRAEQAVLWRKNENTGHCPQANSNPTSNSHPGVDLNRNYPWDWASAAGSQCGATYPGAAAASEPETQAVRDYVSALFPNTRPGSGASVPADIDTQGMFLDVHSYTGLVLWPWGQPSLTGNHTAFQHLARRLAWFNDYEPKQSVSLYPTRGTTIDFAYGERGVPSFTYELGDAFFEPCDNFENTILPDNLASLHYAARVLHAPYRLPAGPDVYGIVASPGTVEQGQSILVTAIVDDTRYNNSLGASPSQPIAGATAFVNRLPWQAGDPGLAMDADDGGFDQTIEPVRLELDTSSLPPGRHLIYVQGHDGAGEQGPPAAVFIEITPANDTIFEDGFE